MLYMNHEKHIPVAQSASKLPSVKHLAARFGSQYTCTGEHSGSFNIRDDIGILYFIIGNNGLFKAICASYARVLT